MTRPTTVGSRRAAEHHFAGAKREELKKGILILECIDRSDPGSEGRFLSHMFELMGISSQYVEVHTPDQLISLMACTPYKYLHITTHGCLTKSNKFTGWWTPNGKVNQRNLHVLEGKLLKTVIVSTACKSADDAFGGYVVNNLGSKFYIAPSNSPKFHNSIMFAHIFYHKHFIIGNSVVESYESYKENYKNPHLFSIYRRDIGMK